MYCANCLNEYDDRYDGCPRCVKKQAQELKTISNHLFIIALIMVISAVVTLASCGSVFS